MTRIGADPEDLKALSRRLDALGRQLDLSGSSIDTTLYRTSWNGLDADRFRATWTRQHRSSIARAAATCGAAAEFLTRQADEQILASDDSGNAPAPLTSGPGASALQPAGRSSEPVVLPGPSLFSSIPSPTNRVPAAAVGADRWIPDEVMSFTVGGEATVASIVAVGEHDVTIEASGAGRLVTIGTRDAAGLRGSAGASISLGPIEADLSARGDAVLGVITRNSFETDQAGVAMTIARAELDGVSRRLGAAVGSMPVPIPGLTGPITGAITAIGRTLRVFPEPNRTESLVEVAVRGSLAAALPRGAGASGALDGVVRVGVSEGRTGNFLVFEAEGAAATTISAGFTASNDGATPRGEVTSRSATPEQKHSIRLEIAGHDKNPVVVLRSDSTDGTVMNRTTMQFATGTDRDAVLARDLRTIAADIKGGRVEAVLGRLASMQLADHAASVVHTTYGISTTDGAIGGSVGGGISFGGKASLERSRMVRITGGG